MKSGASDPFADDGGETDDADDGGETDAGAEVADRVDDVAMTGGTDAETATDDADEPAGASGTESGDAGTDPKSSHGGTGGDDGDEAFSREELPYVLRRERVKDERPEVHQLFVQQETHDAAVEAERELENRLDVDLSRTDAREAIYRAGMAHLGDAEEILREWGYDL
ncbi:MAG: hypothetical protein ABEJ31_04375 [Haloarculaceae archaeon]